MDSEIFKPVTSLDAYNTLLAQQCGDSDEEEEEVRRHRGGWIADIVVSGVCVSVLARQCGDGW